jgi:hypothetical protein
LAVLTNTSEASVLLAVGDNVAQNAGSDVAAASSSGAGGHTNQELDVLVGARLLGPVVPGAEVESGLGTGAAGEGVDTAVVVVELDLDEVERDGAVEHVVVSHIRVDALGRGGEVVGAVGGVHQAAQLLAKGRHVHGGRLKVEIETVNHGIAERPVRGTSGGTEEVPHILGGRLGLIAGAESTLAVGGTSNREKDGLPLLLAGGDVLTAWEYHKLAFYYRRGQIKASFTYAISGQS